MEGCNEEDARVEIETAILKHKWDCMGQEGEEDNGSISEAERRANKRVAQLAEESPN